MKLINENNVNLNENKFCPINRGLDHQKNEYPESSALKSYKEIKTNVSYVYSF